ncbi:hypothetical protein Cni_G26795 [Canna indica]|uniref:Uncharacterized protein n=1 Tax=Canna indica TaxID=4628 RepID=A0AAQ3L6T6_9LILI|nr:hypothetical protein Cni_G26795 [Canna indica]
MASIDANDDELESSSASKLREYRIQVQIPSLEETLIETTSSKRTRLLDFLNAAPSTADWLKNLNFSSPLAIFRRTLNQKEETSLSVPSPVGVRPRRRRFHVHFFRRINWSSLFRICKEWLKNPMNIALLIWLICVAVSATMLGLLLLGLLDHAFPSKALRNHWIEINNQVLNALFTLMSLYEHPVLFYHLFLLCRWRSEDVIDLRKVYCKDGAYRPLEWVHMTVVVVLLHLTCLSQYTSCALYWEYSRRERPEFLDDLFFGVGLAAPVIAALYTVYSPLGRDCNYNSDEESQASVSEAVGGKKAQKRTAVSEPEWAGGLVDFRDDATVCCLSFFCTCCVFGWNMERLGFGNMYVHIVTFLLLCVAPFWIFNISALNIHDYVVGDVVGVAGVVLCVFGLLYGGYWRIQLRKRFKLPGDSSCCGSASLADYAKWMFCWSCALAQEVRTGNLYDVEDDGLYRKVRDEEEGKQIVNAANSQPCGGDAGTVVSTTETKNLDDDLLQTREEESVMVMNSSVTTMTPPLIQLKDVVGDHDCIQLSPTLSTT